MSRVDVINKKTRKQTSETNYAPLGGRLFAVAAAARPHSVRLL